MYPEMQYDTFQYDHVTDEQILDALSNDIVHLVDVSINHEDDNILQLNNAYRYDKNHVYRIAALVNELLSNELKFNDPCILNTLSIGYCGFGINNGHHRIRALQYLGIDTCMFDMRGDPIKVAEIIRLCSN